jgi:hypothetical protein
VRLGVNGTGSEMCPLVGLELVVLNVQVLLPYS